MGRRQGRKKGSRQYSVETGQAAGRQTEEKKGGWEGGQSPGRRSALGGHGRHGAGGPERAAPRPRGHGGATRDSPWLGVGRRPTLRQAGRVTTASLPALRLAGSGCRTARTAAAALPARSGAQAAGPRQGGPRRPPAPPRPAWDPSREAPSVASLASAPLAVRCQPAPPRPAPSENRPAEDAPGFPRLVFWLCGIGCSLSSALCRGLPPSTEAVGRPEAVFDL